MITRTLSILAACISIIFSSCGDGTNTADKPAAKDTVKAAALGPVAIASVSPSTEFTNAALAISSVKAEKGMKDTSKVSFKFDVKNYELKLQTTDKDNKMCNNSDQGQHIHFILDNGPYKALYEPNNTIFVPNDGKEHYVFAFLSRSYHESVKSKGAAVIYHFKVDKKGALTKLDDPKTPMIIYSRPKGDYAGKDTANILLDFYVWNCSLGADACKVKVEAANTDKPSQALSTTLTKWEPSFIHNLGTGKCKVTLTLLDKDSKPVEGPLTSATREFNLKAK